MIRPWIWHCQGRSTRLYEYPIHRHKREGIFCSFRLPHHILLIPPSPSLPSSSPPTVAQVPLAPLTNYLLNTIQHHVCHIGY